MLSSAFESCLPGLTYLIWRPIIEEARAKGWTLQESLYHRFWRGENIMYHIHAQMMHPMPYLERQRADVYRRFGTLLNGSKVPEWAYHHKRAVDFDFAGFENPMRGNEEVMHEMTPKPHYGNPNYMSVSHFINTRWFAGFWAQKMFFNEKPRGNILTGYYKDVDLKVMDGFYARAKNRNDLKDELETEKVVKQTLENKERWDRNFNEFFPEFDLKRTKAPQKIQEPYYERTVAEIRNSIFLQKWSRALENKTFTTDEHTQIFEFYLHSRSEIFWTQNESDGLFQPTPLYLKFVQTLDLPNVFDINKYTANPPENQYIEKMELNYGINFATVETYRRMHIDYLSQIKENDKVNPLEYKRLRILMGEEVYNPIFRKKLSEMRATPSQSTDVVESTSHTSFVATMFTEQGVNSLDAMEAAYGEARDQVHFTTREVQEDFMKRVREVVKTFIFKSQQIKNIRYGD